jgi:hypothetical protein
VRACCLIVCREIICGAIFAAACVTCVSAAEIGDLQTRVNACRAIADTAARVVCYDRLATLPASKSPAPFASAPLASASPPVSPPSSMPAATVPVASVATAPTSSAAAAMPAAAASGAKHGPSGDDKETTTANIRTGLNFGNAIVTITEVTVGADNRLILDVSDGSRWDQTEDKPMRQMPAVGDEVKISRGALGFSCKLSRHVFFHCKPESAR